MLNKKEWEYIHNVEKCFKDFGSSPELDEALQRLANYSVKSFDEEEVASVLESVLDQHNLERFATFLANGKQKISDFYSISEDHYKQHTIIRTDEVPDVSKLEAGKIYRFVFPPTMGKTKSITGVPKRWRVWITDVSNKRLELTIPRLNRDMDSHTELDLKEIQKAHNFSYNYYSGHKFRYGQTPDCLFIDEAQEYFEKIHTWSPPKANDFDQINNYRVFEYLAEETDLVVAVGGEITPIEIKFWERTGKEIVIYKSVKPVANGKEIYDSRNSYDDWYLLNRVKQEDKFPLLICTELALSGCKELEGKLIKNSYVDQKDIQIFTKDNRKSNKWIQDIYKEDFKFNKKVLIASPDILVGTDFHGIFKSVWGKFDTSFKTVSDEIIFQSLFRERYQFQQWKDEGLMWLRLSKGGKYFSYETEKNLERIKNNSVRSEKFKLPELFNRQTKSYDPVDPYFEEGQKYYSNLNKQRTNLRNGVWIRVDRIGGIRTPVVIPEGYQKPVVQKQFVDTWNSQVLKAPNPTKPDSPLYDAFLEKQNRCRSLGISVQDYNEDSLILWNKGKYPQARNFLNAISKNGPIELTNHKDENTLIKDLQDVLEIIVPSYQGEIDMKHTYYIPLFELKKSQKLKKIMKRIHLTNEIAKRLGRNEFVIEEKAKFDPDNETYNPIDAVCKLLLGFGIFAKPRYWNDQTIKEHTQKRKELIKSFQKDKQLQRQFENWKAIEQQKNPLGQARFSSYLDQVMEDHLFLKDDLRVAQVYWSNLGRHCLMVSHSSELKELRSVNCHKPIGGNL